VQTLDLPASVRRHRLAPGSGGAPDSRRWSQSSAPSYVRLYHRDGLAFRQFPESRTTPARVRPQPAAYRRSGLARPTPGTRPHRPAAAVPGSFRADARRGVRARGTLPRRGLSGKPGSAPVPGHLGSARLAVSVTGRSEQSARTIAHDAIRATSRRPKGIVSRYIFANNDSTPRGSRPTSNGTSAWRTTSSPATRAPPTLSQVSPASVAELP